MGGGAALTLLFRLILMIIILVHGGGFMSSCNAVGITSIYVRNFAPTVDMPYHSDVFSIPPGFNAPQQVHLTQGDHDGRAVIVSWVTKEFPGSSEVLYWTDEPYSLKSEVGIFTRYNFYNYVSGYIHHVNLTDLAYSTKYYYSIGFGESIRSFCFHTPPPVGPDVPYTFGVIGDLGQTYDSNRTLGHYMENPLKGEALLFVGDLAYADHYKNHDQVRWDTFGRFIERSAAYQPFIWAAGNHELDFVPDIGEIEPFKPFLHRYPTPYPASQSISPLWYSIKRASAYIIVLSSYSAYGKYTPQYVWLEKELGKVNRSETPWLIVMVHSPWYNSYDYHYMEGETMRVQFESWFVKYKVDVVFAGHVHAYERTERVSNIAYDVVNGKCNPLVKDQSAPVYITIGDGGNIEGLASRLTEPQPEYSAFREQSFGHAMFSIKNRTHAYYSWNRNQDGVSVEADKMWFFNRIYHPVDDSTTTKN